MELGLTLGEAPPRKPFSFPPQKRCNTTKLMGLDFGFCMSLGRRGEEEEPNGGENREASPPLQLDLMPLSTVPRPLLALPWSSEQGNSEESNRCLDVNRVPSGEEPDEGAYSQPLSSSSPTSAAAAAAEGGGSVEAERASSRVSDEDENGLARKKLRLSREQSAYLEESFKEHSTLNPKQKLALAKQLNLRPRQVEVWFQNRRARTKLKQTEVDCEYLKKCCEKLTEENRRLQKELQELRALKTSQPFYMHLPATTLTMCPSCEKVASTAMAAAGEGGRNQSPPPSAGPQARPRFYPFAAKQNQNSVGGS